MIVLIAEVGITLRQLPGKDLFHLAGGKVVEAWRLRQRCGGAMFIPFFPIGQVWEFRLDGDTKWYPAPEYMDSVLNEIAGKVSAPWYSWTGTALTVVALILLLAGVIG